MTKPMTTDIDISKAPKPKVLAALYNAVKAQGLGAFHLETDTMTEVEAEQLLSKRKRFDYWKGRCLFLDLRNGDRLSPRLYDRDNGTGRALQVLQAAGLDVSVAP